MAATPQEVIRKTRIDWLAPPRNSLFQLAFQKTRSIALAAPGYFEKLGEAEACVLKRELLPELFHHVGHGNEEEAKRILSVFPELLTEPGNMVDIAGNYFENITLLDYMLWAPDSHMRNMAWDCVSKSEKGEEIQLKCLTRLDAYEVNGGIEYSFNGEKHREKHFDFQPLINAYQTYITSYDRWTQERTLTRHWDELDALWLNIGKEQNRLPASVRNEYCRGDRSFHPTPQFTEEKLPRTLEFFNWRTENYDLWGVDCGVGSAFSIYRGAAGDPRGCQARAAIGRSDLAAVAALCKVRLEVDLPAFIERVRQPIQNQTEIPGVPSACP